MAAGDAQRKALEVSRRPALAVQLRALFVCGADVAPWGVCSS